jgi:hypothetical protein
MKHLLFTLSLTMLFFCSHAQMVADTTNDGASIIIKDARLSVLESKMEERNIAAAKAADKPTITKTSSTGIVLTSGYRLMVISSNDRDLVMKVRAQLYQYFPDQKQYMSFQMPNTKIKFGNFLSRPQAEQARKKIMAMKLVSNNIYILPDTVEMKVEKSDGDDDDKKDSKAKK